MGVDVMATRTGTVRDGAAVMVPAEDQGPYWGYNFRGRSGPKAGHQLSTRPLTLIFTRGVLQ